MTEFPLGLTPTKDFSEEMAAMSMMEDAGGATAEPKEEDKCQYMRECRLFFESLTLQGIVSCGLGKWFCRHYLRFKLSINVLCF